jgi:hypothetical protein
VPPFTLLSRMAKVLQWLLPVVDDQSLKRSYLKRVTKRYVEHLGVEYLLKNILISNGVHGIKERWAWVDRPFEPNPSFFKCSGNAK